ncbi:YlaF family protein [Metabacillus idriensis]|uniref:YlaF family protein n=1 Tax=Metabacillus idriensis TaxID=324768 RepID=UPI00163A54D5|nr:YlaF family protein [Metabacillus idriensis]QNG58929.1 YlaF family protein [Bacillus sp. PAMC26568]
MKSGKWVFFLLALIAAGSMICIGIAVGERSILGILLSIIALIAAMGFGFATKKKMRDKGLL